MTINNMIFIVALILDAVVLISIPFRIKKYGKRIITENKGQFIAREIGIFISSFAVILLCYFISFGFVGQIALCGCGVMGSYIGSKEMVQQQNQED